LPISDCQLPIWSLAFGFDWEVHLKEKSKTLRPKTKDQIGNWQSEIGNA